MVCVQGHSRHSAGNSGTASSIHPPLSFDFLPQPFQHIGPNSPLPPPFHPFTSTSPFTNLPISKDEWDKSEKWGVRNKLFSNEV
ncbi:hypothetical protein CROQUDRAFT_102341 [Cronartium quercuum f. sp. fusiforme G11]|uniref:Uncharacterized protein n=1 Tax=Cronartium quercuum f. sp. fusiforme G11 TaxID=708437 RepID=A0A9P6T639_9BASI|nr:hypothetical protein CROQUDRAFT_102341 [Cronartium quercuum f. sp. fusiforme G11]